MKKILIIAAATILSGALFVSIALAGNVSVANNPSSDISSDITSLDITSSEISSTEIVSSENSEQSSSGEISSTQQSSEQTSSKITSSEATSSAASSENTSSEETSSEQTSSEETSSEITSSEPPAPPTIAPPSNEKRAVWISYLELKKMFSGGSKSSFTNAFSKACNNIADFGLNTVIVQVRPFSDALYNSSYFPYSHIISGVQGQDPGYDPLKEMVKIAHNHGLKIEAWINPYRIRTSDIKLSSQNPAVKWAGSDYVVSIGVNKYYNPAYNDVQELIVDGVAEIVRNYDVDGIHFDDYFYPTTDASFDQNAYNSLGDGRDLGDFRRDNVTILMKKVYNKIKSINPSVTFGISPQGNNQINYNSQYVDVKTIINKGYIDYICPQIYYGFNNSQQPFSQTVKEWNGYVSGTDVKLYVGIAAYKVGTVDNWAGDGKYEWQNTTDILKRQVLETGKYNGCKGFFLYRYESLFKIDTAISSQMETEKQNLQSIF